MITLVQRVTSARVRVDGETVGEIGPGLLLYVGVQRDDCEPDADATAAKLVKLRCFAGRTPMDRTVGETGGACLVVSQFTLAADLSGGNRPSFTDAAAPPVAEPLYHRVVERLRAAGLPVSTGIFGASMSVESANDGPATFVLAVHGGRVAGGAGPT